MATMKRPTPATEPFDPETYAWPADELARFKAYIGEAGFADVVAAEKLNGATAHATPAGPGHNVNGGEHDWRPDEVEALHDSGTAARASRAGKILPREDFDAIVQESLKAYTGSSATSCSRRSAI